MVTYPPAEHVQCVWPHHIDIAKYPRVRFCIEVNFDGSRESIVDSGIEVRYRKELRK